MSVGTCSWWQPEWERSGYEEGLWRIRAERGASPRSDPLPRVAVASDSVVGTIAPRTVAVGCSGSDAGPPSTWTIRGSFRTSAGVRDNNAASTFAPPES
eukprot:scaffold215341_cov30-Tisochrysis_lutea.AAC.7